MGAVLNSHGALGQDFRVHAVLAPGLVLLLAIFSLEHLEQGVEHPGGHFWQQNLGRLSANFEAEGAEQIQDFGLGLLQGLLTVARPAQFPGTGLALPAVQRALAQIESGGSSVSITPPSAGNSEPGSDPAGPVDWDSWG